MKKVKINQIAGLLLIIIFFSGCFKDHITHTYTLTLPVYKSLTAVRAEMKSAPAASFTNTGKIYIQGKYIFLNEFGKGIHIIDNSNPSSPRNISFISVPGNEDIAVKGQTLYADSYSDLVAFDISDPNHVSVKKIVDNIFPDHGGYSVNMSPDSVMILVDWITKDTTVDVDTSPQPIYYANCPSCSFIREYATISSSSPQSQTQKGIGGSMARFAVINDYLYTVNTQSLSVYDVSNSENPLFKNTLQMAWGIETIYPFENRLFIGSNSGVFMFDIENTPDNPKAAGQFSHARACDPVVADNHYAFVTLSDGSKCAGYQNQLDIVDITQIQYGNSSLVKSYQLTHPLGLSKDGDILFVCDDQDGLKIYDVSDVQDLKMIGQAHDTETFDVIAVNGLAIVVGKDGLYQYDYTDLKNIKLLSKLSGKN
ncbi:MAG: hypothetical protein JST75_15195 [Bacteroidetes bacterium]|nr:hypothetical protein [Bacteroidota bacterium]